MSSQLRRFTGINAVEMDTRDQYYVGLGGLPNAEGVMEMDAAIMDGQSMSYGAVMAIRCYSIEVAVVSRWCNSMGR